MLSDQNARLAAARKLTDARGRRQAGRFLVEGIQGIREALRLPDRVVEIFAVDDAPGRDVVEALAASAGAPVSTISTASARALSETVTPQGLIAVCTIADRSLTQVLANAGDLVVGLVEANDPGNVGTIVRLADAAGATGVALSVGSVDVHNGKSVRASAGSLFHVDIATDVDPPALIAAARGGGRQVLATSGAGETDLFEYADAGGLARPTLWLFGNEARGLPADVLTTADHRVRIPIFGAAESLNLATAAAVCLYASARELARR